jgi:hypothetical protein
MKKLTSTVFAALIGLTLSMPAWSQAPSNTQTQTSKKSDDKDSKDAKGKKASKKKGKKDDKSTDKKTTTPDKK